MCDSYLTFFANHFTATRTHSRRISIASTYITFYVRIRNGLSPLFGMNRAYWLLIDIIYHYSWSDTFLSPVIVRKTENRYLRHHEIEVVFQYPKSIVLSILTSLVLGTLGPGLVLASTDTGVIQETVQTGSHTLDSQINAFYKCISDTHKDPPSILIVDQCFNDNVNSNSNYQLPSPFPFHPNSELVVNHHSKIINGFRIHSSNGINGITQLP